MIKVIKEGKATQTKVFYEITCKRCGTVFTCEKEDFTQKIVGHGEMDDFINCPTCGQELELWGHSERCSWKTLKKEVGW